MNVSVIPGGRLLEDDEHVVIRWTSANGDLLRATFVRDGDEARFQFVVRESPTADVPLEVGLGDVPPALREQVEQRGYDLVVPDPDEADEQRDAEAVDEAQVFD